MSDTTYSYLYCGLVGFLFGMFFGVWSEARNWRARAKSGFRRASGGKLYRVIEDGP